MDNSMLMEEVAADAAGDGFEQDLVIAAAEHPAGRRTRCREQLLLILMLMLMLMLILMLMLMLMLMLKSSKVTHTQNTLECAGKSSMPWTGKTNRASTAVLVVLMIVVNC